MSKGKPIGLLGGAFDPVHNGHILMALGCMETLDLQEVNFIPASISPLKSATRTPQQHRLAMLEQALNRYPQLTVDDMELKRGGVSYTIDTLIDLRRRNPQQSLCFIMGMDAFDSLPAWRRWSELTDYAHLVVIDRKPQHERRREDRLQAYYAERACSSAATLHGHPGGFIHRTDVSVPDISSSRIRAQLSNRKAAENSLPPGVFDYIKENNLYA